VIYAKPKRAPALLPNVCADCIEDTGPQAYAALSWRDENQSQIPGFVVGIAAKEVDYGSCDAIAIHKGVDELVAGFFACGQFVEAVFGLK